MKLITIGGLVAALALVVVGTVSAQGGPRGGRGGMMGGYYGPGMMNGNYGPGMMGGYYGRGMMGGNYGPGMMGGNYGPGMMGGFGYGYMMDGESMWTVLADLTSLDAQTLWTEVSTRGSIAAVLEAHDVTVEAATEALLAAHADELAAAVEAGNLTQAEADAMQVLMSGHISDMLTATRATVGQGRNYGPGMMGGFGYGYMMDEDSLWTVLSDLTGLDAQTLWTEASTSGSIAAVLEAHDVTVEAASEAILAAHAADLATAVENGYLTQAQADARQALLSERITAMLTTTWTPANWPGGRMWNDNRWHHPFFNNGTTPDDSTSGSGTEIVPEATPEVSAS